MSNTFNEHFLEIKATIRYVSHRHSPRLAATCARLARPPIRLARTPRPVAAHIPQRARRSTPPRDVLNCRSLARTPRPHSPLHAPPLYITPRYTARLTRRSASRPASTSTTQHALCSHLFARTRRTTPELPAAVPVFSPRHAAPTQRCPPHTPHAVLDPTRPAVPRRALTPDYEYVRSHTHDPTRPRLRIPSSAVRAPDARSHTIPHVLDPTRPAVPRKHAHSRLRTATSTPSSSSHRSHTYDPTRSHVLDPTRPAASITQVYQQLRLTVTSKTTTYVSHLDLSLLLRCVCFEQHDDQGFEVSDR